MPERRLTVSNRLGLHARASARLVQLANGYSARILLRNGAREVNAKSIMGVMMLAAARGTELLAQAEGADAEAALDALQALFDRRFDEDT